MSVGSIVHTFFSLLWSQPQINRMVDAEKEGNYTLVSFLLWKSDIYSCKQLYFLGAVYWRRSLYLCR